MDLATLEFIKLLPQFMRDDLAIKGLAAGIDSIIPGLYSSLKMLSTWDHINTLPESELDAIAWEQNIAWYDAGATVEIKRDIIKNAVQVQRHLGTKWAVESVVYSYFGDGYMMEWFEYNGEPGYFRIYSTNPSLTNEKLSEFLNLLNKVKRASAVLEGIYITLTGTANLYAGTAFHEVGFEQYGIGAASLNV